MKIAINILTTLFLLTVFPWVNPSMSGDLEPGSTPAETMYSLEELYQLARTRSGQLPKTGRTSSQAIGDDGNLETGASWPVPRFTDNDDGTVRDNLTGLIWLKDASCFAASNWTTALANANSLKGDGSMCDLSDGSEAGDWRLPNIREIWSLVHYEHSDPALPDTNGEGQWSEGDPFSGVQISGFYWSSTSYKGSSSSFWTVYLRNGRCLDLTDSISIYSWPVRGGQ